MPQAVKVQVVVAWVPLVDRAGTAELVTYRRLQGARERGDAVLASLAVADDDLAAARVEVEDAQAQALGEAQTCAVEQ